MPTTRWIVLLLPLAGCTHGGGAGAVTDGVPPKADAPGIARNVAYGEGSGRVLDLYVPQGRRGEPIVAFVHGGAWQGGSRSEYGAICAALQARGLAAATIDYRLSPAVRHPAHAEDVAHALAWLVASAPRHGYDPRRLFVVGHSAGGHIAGTIATDPALLALAAPAGFVGLEGIYDLPDLAGRWPTYPEWFLNKAFGANRAAWPAASPTRRPLASRAPWLVVHSKGDELVDMGQAEAFAAHLRKAGVTVETLTPEGESHDGVVDRLGHPEDEVAKAIVAFADGGSEAP